jgi:hypothetical protein
VTCGLTHSYFEPCQSLHYKRAGAGTRRPIHAEVCVARTSVPLVPVRTGIKNGASCCCYFPSDLADSRRAAAAGLRARNLRYWPAANDSLSLSHIDTAQQLSSSVVHVRTAYVTLPIISIAA